MEVLDNKERGAQAVVRTRDWFERVVLGLNLCPYAHQPFKANSIRFSVFYEGEAQSLLEKLECEVELLVSSSPGTLETTLIVLPEGFDDFYFYLSIVDMVDGWLASSGWEGRFQVASFHPEYQFQGAALSDRGNLTNRSPHPMLHLLREASLTAIVDSGADTASVPERNIARVNDLLDTEVEDLFPHVCPKPL